MAEYVQRSVGAPPVEHVGLVAVARRLHVELVGGERDLSGGKGGAQGGRQTLRGGVAAVAQVGAESGTMLTSDIPLANEKMSSPLEIECWRT